MGPIHMTQQLEPLVVTINDGSRISGRSRSELYRLLVSGKLKAKKNGRRTLIIYESLKQLIDDSPDATFPLTERKREQAAEAEELLGAVGLGSKS
jgi:hypothetical protein